MNASGVVGRMLLAMSNVHGLVLAGIGFAALILIFGAIVLVLRRRLLNSQTPSEDSFTLADLRSLRDSGQITQEEYERARQQIVSHMSRESQSDSAAGQ